MSIICTAAQQTDAAHDFRHGVCIKCGAMMFNLAVGSESFPTPAPKMTAERLKSMAVQYADHRVYAPTPGFVECLCGEITDLLAHIVALTARVAELERQIEHWQSVHQTTAEANERLRTELAAARKDARRNALEEAARLVETIVVSGPEDDEVDHDDYRDMRIAEAIRALQTKDTTV